MSHLTNKKKPTHARHQVAHINNNHSLLLTPAPIVKDHKMVNYIRQTVSNLTYSSYKLGGSRFDPAEGIYIVDCSSYVDRVLKATYPQAFSRLVSWSGTKTPTTYDYYHYFIGLDDRKNKNWQTIDDIEALLPGDIIVFRYKRETKGHVMIVMNKPVRQKGSYLLRITDSAPVRHSKDTRSKQISGIGIGSMLIKINPKTFQPYAYAWNIGGPWRENVAFAMARPLGKYLSTIG